MNADFDLAALRGGVAVLTGSASGLGLAMAEQARSLGMHVCLSDVREGPLLEAVKRLRGTPGEGLGVEGFVCDVTDPASVEALLVSVRHAFGSLPIQFLAANAGVLFSGSTVLSGTLAEWRTTFEVNVIGVFLTLRTFVPEMLLQRERSVVEITASVAGVSFGGFGPYNLSKLSALGVAEALWGELRLSQGSASDRISIVALCPAIVSTELLCSGDEATSGEVEAERISAGDASSARSAKMFSKWFASGMSADFVASEMFRHVSEGKFYCLIGNTVERDGFEMDPERIASDRYAAMLSRRLEPFRSRGASLPPRLDLSELRGGVAVLTGSASGLGLAMAEQARSLGMHVCLSDMREGPLLEAVKRLRGTPGEGLGVEGFVCDVTDPASVEALLVSVRRAFGSLPIQFLAANAGVLFSGSTVLSGTLAEWRTTLNVNVLGAALTLRTFVPEMVKQNVRCVVETTASAAGLVFGGAGPYGVSKLAALGLAEELHQELKSAGGTDLTERVRVVALCPAIVTTDLLTSGEAACPSGVNVAEVVHDGDTASTLTVAGFRSVWEHGMSPMLVAREVFAHASEGKFYCILDNSLERDGFTTGIEHTMTDRLNAILSRSITIKGRPSRFEFAVPANDTELKSRM